MTGPACHGTSGPPDRCPAWCGRQDPHDVHIKNLGLAEGVYVQLACAEGSDAPTRLREPQVIFRYIAGPGTGDVTAWVRASEAAQLAVIFARLGHRELSGLVASAAEVAVTEVHA